MASDLNGGSGNSTTPQTRQNRCYQRDSEAAATAGDGSGNGFYLPDKRPRPAIWAPSKRCPTTTPEPHLLGEFPMTCYRCHVEADS